MSQKYYGKEQSHHTSFLASLVPFLKLMNFLLDVYSTFYFNILFYYNFLIFLKNTVLEHEKFLIF